MTTLTEVVYRDDLTGERIEGEVHYEPVVIDGVLYELTFGEESHRQFRAAIEPFLAKADSHKMPKDLRARMMNTNTSHRRDTRNGAPTRRDSEQTKKMREWWYANAEKLGLPKPSRTAPIPESVADAFDQYGGMNVGNGNDPEAVREAVKAAKKATDKPVREVAPDEALPSVPGQRVTSESKPKAQANGKGNIPDDEFVDIVKQVGSASSIIIDAIEQAGYKPLKATSIHQRVSRLRKQGKLPAAKSKK